MQDRTNLMKQSTERNGEEICASASHWSHRPAATRLPPLHGQHREGLHWTWIWGSRACCSRSWRGG